MLFVLIYGDYRQRERVLRRLRATELERARKEQRFAESRVASLRSDLDAGALLEALVDVRELFERNSPEGEGRLDELIADLRAKLTPG